MFRSKLLPAFCTLAALVPASAFAVAVDVTAVETDIEAQLAPVATIGGAVLLLLVAIKAFKWVRRAM